MSRTVRDSNLENRTARARFDPRGEPYYRGEEPGLHLGYRKPRTGTGRWLVRRYVEGKYSYYPLGVADDHSDADGRVILNFKQAQNTARKLLQGINPAKAILNQCIAEKALDFLARGVEPACYLYRHYHPSGDLLYVGVSLQPLRR